MLRATPRSVQRLTRSFATVVDTAGLKIAAVDSHQPTASVTVLVKAGSRYQSKPGVAHALKNFAFKSTASRSALGTVRESELYGGLLSSSLSREHLALTAEFLRGDEAFFVDVLTSFITSAKYTRHEFEEYVIPVLQSESEVASADPANSAIELAHALAFRSGLGLPLYASAHSSVTSEDIKSYASSVFTKDNIAVLGTGISQEKLSTLVDKAFAKLPSSSTTAGTSSSHYFGGESRLEAHGGPQTVFIGFGGVPSADLAALSAHLSTAPAVKWSQSVSPLAAAIPIGASVQSVYLPYSDAALFGLLIQAQTSAQVKVVGKAAVFALQAAAQSVENSAVKSAINKAKFSAASTVDERSGLVSVLGSQVLAGAPSTLEATLASFDKVSATSLAKAAATLIKAKPTYVAVGDLATLPFSDELGL